MVVGSLLVRNFFLGYPLASAPLDLSISRRMIPHRVLVLLRTNSLDNYVPSARWGILLGEADHPVGEKHNAAVGTMRGRGARG